LSTKPVDKFVGKSRVIAREARLQVGFNDMAPAGPSRPDCAKMLIL